MRKDIITGLLVFVVFFPSCKKEAGSGMKEKYFTLQGTVYVDDIPTANVNVEFRLYGVIYKRATDTDGTYLFKEKTSVHGGFYAAYYAIRALNPLTDVWTESFQATAPLGTVKTKDFYFYSE